MHSYRTPETNLVWHDLKSWRAGLVTLGRRHPSAKRYRQLAAHLHALPADLVYGCNDRPTLLSTRTLVIHPQFGNRPPRHHRADAPHTPIIVAINNRLAQLAAHFTAAH